MIDYGFIHRYPTTNFHELNLDWILAQMIELRSDMKNFVNQNTIKYADPIQWNITTQYEGNTVVIEPNSGNAYISSQPVPAGVAITNEDYWSVIGNFSVLYESIKESIAAADDGSNLYATEARAEGSLLWLNSKLYKVLSDISVGALYITSGTGQNLEEVTIEELLDDIDTEINTINNSIVAVNERITDFIVTTPEEHGAAGDGATDDTSAIVEALTSADIVICNNTYLVSDKIELPIGKRLIGKGTIKATFRNDVIEVKGKNIIQGLSFIDTLSGYDNIGDYITGYNVSDVSIIGCNFNQIHLRYCIRFETSDHITVNHNNISEYSYGGIMFAVSCKHIEVCNNNVINGRGNFNNRYPICVSGYTDTGTLPAEFVKCNYNYISDDAHVWEGIDSHGVANAEFIGNKIIGCQIGIALTSPTNASLTLEYNNRNVIIENNYIDCYAYAIGVVDVDNIVSKVVIKGNQCIYRRTSPIYQTSGTACIKVTGSRYDGVEIAYNTVQCDGVSIAIGYGGVGTNVAIHHNNIASFSGNVTDSIAIFFDAITDFWNMSVYANFIHNVATSVKAVTGSTRSRLIKYHDNDDNGVYINTDYITTPRTSLASPTTTCGTPGDLILNSSRTNTTKFWLHIATGWVGFTGTNV